MKKIKLICLVVIALFFTSCSRNSLECFEFMMPTGDAFYLYDDREDVEAVLGEGAVGHYGRVHYADDISCVYADNELISVKVNNKWTTSNLGLVVGMSADDIPKQFSQNKEDSFPKIYFRVKENNYQARLLTPSHLVSVNSNRDVVACIHIYSDELNHYEVYDNYFGYLSPTIANYGSDVMRTTNKKKYLIGFETHKQILQDLQICDFSKIPYSPNSYETISSSSDDLSDINITMYYGDDASYRKEIIELRATIRDMSSPENVRSLMNTYLETVLANIYSKEEFNRIINYFQANFKPDQLCNLWIDDYIIIYERTNTSGKISILQTGN